MYESKCHMEDYIIQKNRYLNMANILDLHMRERETFKDDQEKNI